MTLEHIKLLIMDVDGVLTDGTISVSTDGSETKHFNVRDWTGIKYLQRVGIQTALVSGNTSEAVSQRAEYIGIKEVHQGAKDKLPVVRDIIKRAGLKRGEVAYLGDDLTDIPPVREVGFSAAVADAHEELKSRCDHVTTAPGGRGAVRELAEMILKAQGKWAGIMKRYLNTESASD
ncbi:MAG TPA: HAD hydrolase family protein [Planctomycetota bacterium]|nr:HAD hydrolase family protein [Planctomycetota bacterium]